MLPAAAVNPQWATLGRRLFFERAVSADGQVGCVTCHNVEHSGADGLARSKGVFGRDNPRNAPTIWNVATQYAQHWRSDRESVEDQATRALLGKASFGLESNEQAVEKMRAVPGLTDAFVAAFPDTQPAVSAENWGKAIGAYERTLRAASPFDAFVEGDASALNAQAQRGLTAFLDLGCAGCHAGPLLGGAGARKFGVHTDYWTLTGSTPIDNGRFDATQQEADRYVFKVPPLRNVAGTGPYFHDGSVSDLGDAVSVMARAQLGSTLAPEVVQDLVAFLQSLSSAPPAGFSAP
jgi:cytochrome c peroxidase